MPAKKITTGAQNVDELLKGVKVVSDTVKITMGPRGQNVLIERIGQTPLMTKDGVTVATEITLEHGVEQMGASLVIDAANRTAEAAGDGTTCASLLSHEIYAKGLKLTRDHEMSSIRVSSGIRQAVKKTSEFLTDLARSVKGKQDLSNVATIAANGDIELGKLIGKAMNKTGSDGCIVVQEGKGTEDWCEFVDGMQVNSGMASPHFRYGNKVNQAEHKDALVVVINAGLTQQKSVGQILEIAAVESKPIIIFARNFGPEAMKLMAYNHLRGNIKCVAIRIPEHGDIQSDIAADIAAVTGATVVDDSSGISVGYVTKNQKWKGHMGKAAVVKATKTETVIIKHSGNEEAIAARVEDAKQKQEAAEADALKDKHQRRIASLSNGIAKLMVTSPTHTALGQKKARVEDALYAVKAAADTGILPGGGIALFYAANVIRELAEQTDDESTKAGIQIVAEAIRMPLFQIAKNRDDRYAYIVPEKLEAFKHEDPKAGLWYGWDADRNTYGDMYQFGIIDPLKVPITALENAASVAIELLNTGATIELLQPDESLASRVPEQKV